MQAIVIAVLFATVGAIVVTAVHAQRRAARVRTDALRDHAERRGWSFHPAPGLAAVPNLQRFELFQQGRHRTAANLMAGDHRGFRIAVFDYSYVTGAGKSRKIWRQTVVSVHSVDLDLPAFSIRPEHAFHRIAELFGAQDIDLDGRPEFSRRYLLRGTDETAIRNLFSSAVVDRLERIDRCCAAAHGTILFLWRPGRFARVEEIDERVTEAEDLAARFARSAGARPAGDS